MAKILYIWDSELSPQEMDALLSANTLPLDSPFTAQGFVLDRYKEGVDANFYNMIQLPRSSKRFLRNTYFHLRVEPAPKGCRLIFKEVSNLGHIPAILLMAWPVLNGVNFIRSGPENFQINLAAILLLAVIPVILIPLVVLGRGIGRQAVEAGLAFLGGVIGDKPYPIKESRSLL